MDTIGQELLWVARLKRKSLARDSIAPSWSWVTFPGGVYYCESSHSEIQYTYYPTLVNAACNLVSRDDYGQAAFARLTLEVQLVHCIGKHVDKSATRFNAHVNRVEKGVPMAIPFADEFQDGESLWLARGAEAEPKTDYNTGSYFNRFHHLVLRKSPETGLYTRAGTCFMLENAGLEITRRIFDGVSLSTIVLV
jgi:hypothetical protein